MHKFEIERGFNPEQSVVHDFEIEGVYEIDEWDDEGGNQTALPSEVLADQLPEDNFGICRLKSLIHYRYNCRMDQLLRHRSIFSTKNHVLTVITFIKFTQLFPVASCSNSRLKTISTKCRQDFVFLRSIT
ncbi:hypothetical protein ACLB2K_036830 [Fragaria x ananassa]